VAPAPAPAAKKTAAPKVEQPIAAPAVDLAAEQLAASVLQNQQLQKTIDELNARLQAQDEQIAGQKKQVTELETRLAEVKQTPPNPPPPVAVTPAAVTVDEADTFNWPLLVALTTVIALLLGLFIYRRRQQAQALPEDSPTMSSVHEPVLDPDDELLAKSAVEKSAAVHHDETPAGDVLEGVGIYLAYGRFTEAAGLLRDALAKEPERTDLALQLLDVLGKQGDVAAYDDQENSLREAGLGALELQDIRGRYPKLERPAPIAAAPLAAAAIVSPALKTDSEPDDDFQLNLSELSMDSSWDLVSPFDSNEPSKQQPDAEAPAFTSSLYVMPDGFEIPEEPSLDEPELEWVAEPDAQALDDDFLAEFGDIGTSLELEPLSLEPVGATSAGKLEQAQNCIDDGDLDSAIELLNELLKEADEPLKQTARTLLAGIR
jgi:FimV-like protein